VVLQDKVLNILLVIACEPMPALRRPSAIAHAAGLLQSGLRLSAGMHISVTSRHDCSCCMASVAQTMAISIANKKHKENTQSSPFEKKERRLLISGRWWQCVWVVLVPMFVLACNSGGEVAYYHMLNSQLSCGSFPCTLTSPRTIICKQTLTRPEKKQKNNQQQNETNDESTKNETSDESTKNEKPLGLPTVNVEVCA
jgi:hypothetical protein